MKKKIGLVFSHCHWDIEWYMPFGSFAVLSCHSVLYGLYGVRGHGNL